MRNKGSVVKVDSSAVQGDGSFVVLRKPNWKAMRGALSAFQAEGGEGNQAAAGLAMLDSLLPGMITAWNWTDEENHPLPLPSKDRTVLDEMDPQEAMFLVQEASKLVNLDQKN
jgi:hypothetical protein